MLRFNFERIMKARGIDRPFSFLLKRGYSENTASRIVNNRLEQLNLKTVEKLCTLFNCTPNDLLEWTPGKSEAELESHPLYPLMRRDKVGELTQLINSVPLEKLQQIEKIILEEMKK